MTTTAPSAPETPIVRVDPGDDGVALVTICRPEARNALSAAVWEGLERAFAAAEADGSRAVVLTGAGNYFSAGGDLKSPPSGGTRAFAPVQRLQLAHAVMAQITALPIPVIAAVERGAAGLGWGLALACDMIFCSHGTSFAAPFTARGVVPDGGVGQILVSRLGRQRALELLLSGRSLSAEEALAHGLVARVTGPGEATATALAFAAALPTDVPNAMEMTKRLVRQSEDLSQAAYLEQELLAAALCQLGPEAATQRARFRARAGTSE